MNIPYELVGFSEIDKFAIKSYCAIHNVNQNKNLGDVKDIKTKELKDVDFMTWRISLPRCKYSRKSKRHRERENKKWLIF